MFFPTVKRSEKEIEKLSEYERQRLKNIAELELQFSDPLDILQESVNQLKNSNDSAKQHTKSKKSKFNSDTSEKTSKHVNFVRRSSRIIQEKR
ncbi:unnamed protein product [Macrosiphum euphorbiae]|uniref:Uncharacterized protein n=1 Tax=Macrosiphum euphorbiae TaxID=13131 RepID=A0AAV0WSC3_9HEMI|nr:unnamed protein product [Macrosiphum euphorbiae]